MKGAYVLLVLKKMIDSLKITDSRRLTGPNLFSASPGAILDVAITKNHCQKVIDLWKKHCQTLLRGIGWNKSKIHTRTYKGGASLVITAPIDCLYAATEVNEAAWSMTTRELAKNPCNTDNIIAQLLKEIDEESNTALINLEQKAYDQGIKFLSDDDHVSLGYGNTCQIYPVNDIPDINSIPWHDIKDIPVALVTGTNGKSTTVRLSSAIIKAAGMKCGITSTDYIRVDDTILDTGDYSGPGGARTLLRHPETEVAILEVARGGLLRRGLGINQASTVLITNVAEDHLGEYGVDNLQDMIATKFIVRQAINKDQELILNADDKGCVEFAQNLSNNITWFSWDKNNPVIIEHLSNRGNACYVDDDNNIIYHNKEKKHNIIDVNRVPITLSGAAIHNIHNALAATALSFALGIENTAIEHGLKAFDSSPENNPGRGNVFEKNGVKIIVDFAHNEHGLSMMAQTINNIQCNRKLILLGQAGDRSNALIEGLMASALEAQPDQLVICEMLDYLRGRKKGEIPKIMTDCALKSGMQAHHITYAKDTIDGTKKALYWAKPGDVLLILALTNREQIIDILNDWKA